MKIKHKVAKVTTDIFDHLFINVAPNPQKIPDRKPIRNPTKGKDHAALVRSGASLEKYDQLIGILVKNMILAKKSNKYLFCIKTFIYFFF